MKNPVYVKNTCCLIFLLFCSATSQQDTNHATEYNGESIFKTKLIVPHLMPSSPKETCAVIYGPGLIVVPGQFYFPYQIQGMPEISWDYKSEKFYTVVILGALEKVPSHQNNTNKLQKQESIPPENSWHQCVMVNVRKNNMGSGTIVQPYVNTQNNEPNGTHNVVYAFSIYEQFKKIDLNNLNAEDNSTQTMLERHFTPMSNFTKRFGGSFLIAGNFFYVVPKQSAVFRDYSPVRYDIKREMMSIMKPDDYVGMR